jgi:hypothetical protein
MAGAASLRALSRLNHRMMSATCIISAINAEP